MLGGVHNLISYVKKRRTWALSLLVSALFHGLLFTWHTFFSEEESKVAQTKPRALEVLTPEKAKEVLKRMRKATKVKLKKQIVNSELRGVREKPQKTRFLGKTNQSYDRQTIARKLGIFKKAGLGEKGSSLKKGQEEKGTAREKKTASVLESLSFRSSDFKLPRKVAQKKGKGPGKKAGVEGGDPNEQGLSANNDFIEEIPLGDFTQLNTVEFKYYGFYHRIRQKLEQHWGNTLRQKAKKLFQKGRRLASNENHITSLTIQLNHKGEIVKVMIDGRSGVKELDDAAVESFNKAGPFPNPPKGMVKNGHATIKWGFVVKS